MTHNYCLMPLEIPSTRVFLSNRRWVRIVLIIRLGFANIISQDLPSYRTTLGVKGFEKKSGRQ